MILGQLKASRRIACCIVAVLGSYSCIRLPNLGCLPLKPLLTMCAHGSVSCCPCHAYHAMLIMPCSPFYAHHVMRTVCARICAMQALHQAPMPLYHPSMLRTEAATPAVCRYVAVHSVCCDMLQHMLFSHFLNASVKLVK